MLQLDCPAFWNFQHLKDAKLMTRAPDFSHFFLIVSFLFFFFYGHTWDKWKIQARGWIVAADEAYTTAIAMIDS